MSDVKPRPRDATSGVRVAVNRDLFLAKCAEKGARTEAGRAALLDTTEKMSWNYREGRVEPRLGTARRIADTLGVDLDDLWPRQQAA